MNVESERRIAHEAFSGVLSGGFNNIVLNKVLSCYPSLPRERRAFVTECVNGALRRLYTLDYIINQVSGTNTRSMDRFVLNTLRLAVYELGFMEKPAAHAICDEAVNLVAESKYAAHKGFVNANLRSIVRLFPQIMSGIDKIKASDKYAWFEIKHSCSRAVAQALEWELGFEEAVLLMEHFNTFRPPVTIRVNTLKTSKDKLSQHLSGKGISVNPGVFMDNALRLTDNLPIASLSSFRNGWFHVMDEGAMFAVAAAGLQPGQRVMDICAAPGGKSFLAAMELGDDAHINARDIHPHKLDLIRDGTKRLGIKSIAVNQADAEEFDADSENAYDAVIADVPCSGLGLLGKKPDIRYRFDVANVQKLQGLQRRILNNCARYVKPGGTLLYSTCTLTPEENRKNALWFAKTHGFKPKAPSCAVPNGADISEEGFVTMLPHRVRCDGFFAAVFSKGL